MTLPTEQEILNEIEAAYVTYLEEVTRLRIDSFPDETAVSFSVSVCLITALGKLSGEES